MKKYENLFWGFLSFILVVGAGSLVYLSLDNVPIINDGEKKTNFSDHSDSSNSDTGIVKKKVDEKRDIAGDSNSGVFNKDHILNTDTSAHKLTLDERIKINPNYYFTSVAKYALPRVVSIYSTTEKNNSLFDLFLPDRGNDVPHATTGSGSVISPDGYILTNNHVIDKANKIIVKLSSKEEYDAVLIGNDPATDLALLKIDVPGELPCFQLNIIDSLSIGEWVMAVGNPLNYNSTVTVGIICALDRNINIIQNSYGIETFIQTDAVINPGNSGGPLLNINRELIGVNTAISSKTGFYEGFGFAVPINVINRVVGDLKKFGKVKRGLLGVMIASLSHNKAKSLGMERPDGVWITGVDETMPAASAGVQVDDVILEVSGEPVYEPNDLQVKVSRFYPEDIVSLKIFREGTILNIDVPLEAIDDEKLQNGERSPAIIREKLEIPELNLIIRNPSDEEYDTFDLDYGVMVDNDNEERNFYKNDVIVKINKHRVHSVERFENLFYMFKESDNKIEIILKRKKQNTWIILSNIIDDF